jgi:HEAT repeat protein
MLRDAALRGLSEREASTRAAAARAALDDDYPRVRVAAIEMLHADSESRRALVERARRDSWPMVRAAAVDALGRHPDAVTVVRRALDDDSQRVRAAAVRALTAQRDRASVDAIAARLMDDDEWPEVIGASIAYARTLCSEALAEALVAVVRRAIRPDPWAPDVELAVEAVDALAGIGGPDAETMLRRVEDPTVPAALRAAAARARTSPRRCR